MADDIQSRVELYLRAERPVRELFCACFGRLCAACGQASAESGEHQCCCTGVRCTDHLAASPVLSAYLSASSPDPEPLQQLSARGITSLLGPAGCGLAWGRPAACNVCICAAERSCLLAVMPSRDAVAFCRALRVFHPIAQPSGSNLDSLYREVEELERLTGAVVQAVEENRARFDAELDRQIARLSRSETRRPTL